MASGAGWAPWAPAGAAIGLREADRDATLRLRLRGGPGDRDADAAATRDFLARAQAAQAAGAVLFGYLGHELGPALEGLPLGAPAEPEGLDDALLHVCAPDALRVATLPPPPQGPPWPQPETWAEQGPGFLAATRALLADIADGRLYQANLTRSLPVEARLPGASAPDTPARVLAAVLAAQPVPYAAWIHDAGRVVVSGSMERFLHRDGGVVTTRPIKGTRPRSDEAGADAVARAALLASSKERAENLMIVDMARHDLGRVARTGGVEVVSLLEAVGYRTLWHLESEVRAALRDDVGSAALLEATLAPASVTGAPKIAATRRFTELEQRRRGPYCGAIGLLGPGGTIRLSVGIRLLVDPGAERPLQIPVGAGIVADSDPEREWEELRWKARATLGWLGRVGRER
ncbi:MAG: para-aminobenzoate synthase, component [Pseudomonadota bacterium]|jgi:anthranilate/para-aminobenzoate synthase component I